MFILLSKVVTKVTTNFVAKLYPYFNNTLHLSLHFSIFCLFLFTLFYYKLADVLCDTWVLYKFTLKYFIKNYIFYLKLSL